jgi:hypothetical protein
MKAVDLPFFFELDADDIFQAESLQDGYFFMRA